MERQEELLQRLGWTREAMTMMYGRQEQKKPRVALEAMKELRGCGRWWQDSGGSRWAVTGANASGLEWNPAGSAAGCQGWRTLLEVAERVANEDEKRGAG